MWRPPQRIEHRPAPGRWPDAAEAASSRLFRPVGLGPVTLAQRTWVPAMVPWRATGEGFVSDGVLDWYRRLAEGRPGAIVAPTARIRRAVRDAGFATPVVVAGGIHNFEQAEGILARGEADVVGMARQSLADPDWFCKVRLGRGAEVRLCEYSNYCEGLDQKHKPVTCKLWDRAGGQRRMVAPGWEGEPHQTVIPAQAGIQEEPR